MKFQSPPAATETPQPRRLVRVLRAVFLGDLPVLRAASPRLQGLVWGLVWCEISAKFFLLWGDVPTVGPVWAWVILGLGAVGWYTACAHQRNGTRPRSRAQAVRLPADDRPFKNSFLTGDVLDSDVYNGRLDPNIYASGRSQTPSGSAVSAGLRGIGFDGH